MKKTAGAFLWAALTLAPAVAYAQHPPVQSPQDQACRDEAARRVFSEPSPNGQDLYARGRQIWYECMARAERSQKRSKRAGR